MATAIRCGSIRLVEKVLAADANRSTLMHPWLLIDAANQGHVGIVQLFVDAGANVNLTSGSEAQPTALVAAAQNGCAAVVEVLLQVDGIEVNVVDFDGNAALLHAAGTTSIETVERLVATGANVHHVNRDGQTALHRAAQHGQVEVVACLLHLGLSVDHADRTGRTPLLWASVYGRTEVVEFLLATTDVGIEYADLEGNTALSIAAKHGHADVVEILLGWGANAEGVVRNGVITCQEDHPSVAARLVAAGADLYV